MELGKSPPYGRCEGGASTVRLSPTGRGQFDLYFCHLVCASSSDGRTEDEIGSSRFVGVGRGGRPLW